MNIGYTKLSHGLPDSSIWDEDDATVRIWITMLTTRDRDGVVRTTVGGLAARARKSMQEVKKALHVFMSPDPNSTTKDHEGRRVIAVEGGWKLVNFEKYRDMLSLQARREYDRIRKAQQRARLNDRNKGKSGRQIIRERVDEIEKVEGEKERVLTVHELEEIRSQEVI